MVGGIVRFVAGEEQTIVILPLNQGVDGVTVLNWSSINRRRSSLAPKQSERTYRLDGCQSNCAVLVTLFANLPDYFPTRTPCMLHNPREIIHFECNILDSIAMFSQVVSHLIVVGQKCRLEYEDDSILTNGVGAH